MSRRAWLRHPARTIGNRPPCPTGLPRFNTLNRAQDALGSHGAPNLTASPCDQCDGAHLVPTENR